MDAEVSWLGQCTGDEEERGPDENARTSSEFYFGNKLHYYSLPTSKGKRILFVVHAKDKNHFSGCHTPDDLWRSIIRPRPEGRHPDKKGFPSYEWRVLLCGFNNSQTNWIGESETFYILQNMYYVVHWNWACC